MDQRHLHPISDAPVAAPRLDVVERASDLAVADRIAYVLANHSGSVHVVVADGAGYAIARSSTAIDVAQALAITMNGSGLRILSIADRDRVTPILLPA